MKVTVDYITINNKIWVRVWLITTSEPILLTKHIKI